MGEITTKANVDIQKIVRDTVNEIGYNNSDYGFDGNTCGVYLLRWTSRAPDIAMGVDKALEVKERQMSEEEIGNFGAGDQGMMFGFASNETEELHALSDRAGTQAGTPPDRSSQERHPSLTFVRMARPRLRWSTMKMASPASSGLQWYFPHSTIRM